MKITRWRLMVTKLKTKFILVDYELELFKRLQNLKQKDMSMKDYTKEFYKLIFSLGIENCQRKR